MPNDPTISDSIIRSETEITVYKVKLLTKVTRTIPEDKTTQFCKTTLYILS